MTDTSKVLVKRLRAVNHMCVEDCFLQSPLFGHAADAIEALQARAEAAEAELAEARAAGNAPAAPLPDKGKMVRPKPGARCGGYPPPSGRAYTPGPRQAVAEYPAQPSPEAVVKAALHDVAREVFVAMEWAAKAGVPYGVPFPKYMEWGNSQAESEARRAASVIIAQIIAQAGKDRPHD
jgi:hypothetical protein